MSRLGRQNAPRLGHTFAPGKLPAETALWGNQPASPRRACVPLRWPPDHCHSQRGAHGSRTLGPRGGPRNPSLAAARTSRAAADTLRTAAPWHLPSSREGRRPAPGSSLAVVRPPPSRAAPPSQPRQIPESLGPLRHPGGF